MADLLGLLRDFAIHNKEIKEESDEIIFNNYAYPRHSKTNYIVWGTDKNVIMSQFYGGSAILSLLSDIFGLPLDQINFVICSLISILLGEMMRHAFSPNKTSGNIRGLIETFFGFAIVIFCYGYQVKCLLLQSMVSYVILIIFPARLAAHLVTYWSLGFLGVVHLYRMHFDYGGYTTDISGPVMIQTQKLTSLAFNLLDGHRLNEGVKLSYKTHEQHAIKKLPECGKFFSYLMYLQGIQVGPFTFYNEYKEYLLGYGNQSIPCAKKQIRAALCLSIIHRVLTAYVAPQFPYIFVLSTDYQRMHMIRRIVFTMISFFLVQYPLPHKFANYEHTMTAIRNLDGAFLWGKQMHLHVSRTNVIQLPMENANHDMTRMRSRPSNLKGSSCACVFGGTISSRCVWRACVRMPPEQLIYY